MTVVFPLLIALLARATPPEPVPVSHTVLIAVPDLVPLGVSSELAQNLTAVITAELARYDGVRAISSREMTVLLGVERQKAMVGCENDACVSQLADALGAEKILTGQLGLIEKSMVFTLQLTDVKRAQVEGRVVKVLPMGKGRIVDGVRGAVTELMGNATSRNQIPRLAVPRSVTAHERERIVLDATRCYDPDGDPLQTEWRQVDGPPALLEGSHEGAATFVGTETGNYSFRVSVTDGRSAPVEQAVEVEVLRRRPFVLGLSGVVFSPFNRLVETDGRGASFRNRTPAGAMLDVGLWLGEHWQLVGTGELTAMHTFTNDDRLETFESFDYISFNVLIGARFYFPFDAFRLWAGVEIGSGRMFFHLKQGEVISNPVTQTVLAEGSAGADLPLGERFGVILKAGIRAQGNTEPMAPFREGITFQMSPGGLFWGVDGSLGAYLRL